MNLINEVTTQLARPETTVSKGCTTLTELFGNSIKRALSILSCHFARCQTWEKEMNIHGTQYLHGAHTISGPHTARPQQASAPPQATSTLAKDAITLSSAAQQANQTSEASSNGEIRFELVNRIRSEIASGTYETPQKLEIALEKLLAGVGS